MLLLLEPSNVVMVVSLDGVMGWLGGGCECYACGDGVEVVSDEQCHEHAGVIYVVRWAKAVSMQAHINEGCTTKGETR